MGVPCLGIPGKRAFIAGVADDRGFGWAIAKALSAAGAEILLGTWVPVGASILLSAIFRGSGQMQDCISKLQTLEEDVPTLKLD
jgi:enoyl-[acyl-carrier-protein] reductase (NADH)